MKRVSLILVLLPVLLYGLDEKQLEVSELPIARFVPPSCSYIVRRNDQYGPEVKG